MYKACIFDLDGTLTDTLESLTYSVNATLHEVGLGRITDEQCKSFVGNGARRLIEEALKATGDEKTLKIDEAMEAYGRIFKEHCTYHVKPYEGIVPLLLNLKNEGVQMAVLSNKPHLRTLDVVEMFFEKDTFTCVYGQCDEIPRKPDPAGIFAILEKLGIKKEECLYIGDSEADIKAGRAAGVDTVGVLWGFRTKEVLEALGATYIIDKPEKIYSIVKGAE